MKAVKAKSAAGPCVFESLEERQMLIHYGYWPRMVNMDDVFTQYPWLDGGGNNVTLIDKGLDYYHPALGGDPVALTQSPRVVNVHDYEDGDNNPFPTLTDTTDNQSGHATGIASLLVGLPMTRSGELYQGILQNSTLYNIRENISGDTQNSIKSSLDWVLANHTALHITAVNLTDFFGTGDTVAVYNSVAKALWEAGIFIATPVANNFLGDAPNNVPPRTAINNPGSNPYIYATGGLMKNDTLRAQSSRGPDLDLLGPAEGVTIAYYRVSTPHETYVDNSANGNSWGTAHIVGTAVLIQQIDPTIKPDEIMKILQDSGPSVLDPDTVTDPNQNIYYKRLDMLAAIQLAYTRRDDASDAGAGNDTLANAATISLNGSNQGAISGRKLLIHDDDFYTFTASGATQFNFALNYSGPSSYPSAELMDANGVVIGSFGQSGLSTQLAAGKYYIHLYNATESLNGTYGISLNQGSVQVAIGQDGSFNDLAYDSGGRLNFAWYDESTDSLKFARRDKSNVWNSPTVVDSSAQGVGQFVSMALDSTGNPGLAYYDSHNADLKYAKFNGTSWSVQTVDSTNTTGYYPSLKFDSKNHPIIAYYYKTSGDLRLASNGGSGWSISTIDSKNDVGRYPSLALNTATGRWSVAYEATTAGAFKYADQNKDGTWSSVVVDAPGQGGGFISLAFDNAKRAAFSYYDAKNADLKYARYTGTKWSTTTIASKNSQGLYTNLFFDSQAGGNPVIFFYNKTGNTLNTARNNGTSWVFATVASGGGRNSRIGLKTDDSETFSWQSDGASALQISDV